MDASAPKQTAAGEEGNLVLVHLVWGRVPGVSSSGAAALLRSRRGAFRA